MTANHSPELEAVLTLRAVPGTGDVSIRRLIKAFGSATRALKEIRSNCSLANLATDHNHEFSGPAMPKLTSSVLDEASADAKRILEDTDSSGAHAIESSDPRYPSRLHELHDPPSVIFVRGTLECVSPPSVAIVGTRNASNYGLRVARAIAACCARSGVAVVSGLARGIDAAAHEAALDAGGRTVAVLGTGPDVVYPCSHRVLQEKIALDGLVLSELNPGEGGHGGTFPRRNRIIAALADITVVVEAGAGSGALITADHAIELGRTVACVPNAIDAASSKGSNALLKAHAEPLLSPDDVLSLLGMTAAPAHGPSLDPVSAKCWDAINRHGAATPAEISKVTGVSLRETASALSLLEIDGLVETDKAGRFVPSVFQT